MIAPIVPAASVLSRCAAYAAAYSVPFAGKLVLKGPIIHAPNSASMTRRTKLLMLTILTGLPAGASDAPRRLSVMWRVVTPGYSISSAAVSQDGRSVAFVRGRSEPFGVRLQNANDQKAWKRTLQRYPWLITNEVMLIEPGHPRPRRIGYGDSPAFVDRALRYDRILRPSKEDGSEDITRVTELDLRSGRKADGPRELPGWTRVVVRSLRPNNRVYWALWVKAKKKGAQDRMGALYVSDGMSGSRRLLLRIPVGSIVDGVYETGHGLMAHVTREIPVKGSNPDSVIELWRLGPRIQLLFTGRRPHGDQSDTCTARPLADGKLQICDALYIAATNTTKETVSTRWWRLDPATGRVETVNWQPGVTPYYDRCVMISPDSRGIIIQISSSNPFKPKPGELVYLKVPRELPGTSP